MHSGIGSICLENVRSVRELSLQTTNIRSGDEPIHTNVLSTPHRVRQECRDRSQGSIHRDGVHGSSQPPMKSRDDLKIKREDAEFWKVQSDIIKVVSRKVDLGDRLVPVPVHAAVRKGRGVAGYEGENVDG